MRVRQGRAGFTLIELTLAMAFVGILLVATVTVIIQVSNMYSKGVTYKLIDQAGRDLGAAMTRDAENAGNVANPIVQPTDPAAGGLGRLCLGGYSYLWGDPAKLRSQNGTAPTYQGTSTDIILARVADAGGSYCTKGANGTYPTAVSQSQATEMLPSDQGDYALQAMQLTVIPTSSQSKLYDISYAIGTNQAGTITSAVACEPPSAATNNFNFCAVNTFDIMVRVGY